MYYPIIKKPRDLLKILAAFFFISVFSFTRTSPACAGELFNATVEEYRAKGYEAQQKGNFDQAISYYMKALSLGDKTAVLYNDIGVVYEELGVFDRAVSSYEQAISIDPNYLPPYLNLAYFYKDQKDTPRALQYFKERYERSGEDDPRRQKIQEAIIALDPTYKDRIVKTELETTGQALEQQARADFSQDVARGERHLEQARAFLAEKNYDRAKVEFDRALAMTPDNPKIVREKQQAVYQQKIEAIKAQAEEALKKLNSGDIETARTEFQNILATIPNEPAPKSKE